MKAGHDEPVVADTKPRLNATGFWICPVCGELYVDRGLAQGCVIDHRREEEDFYESAKR